MAWGLCLLPGCAAQAPADGSAPRVVALSQGSCPAVRDGDVVTLEWNPGFAHPASVLGLAEVTLAFETHDRPLGRGVEPLLVLRAIHGHEAGTTSDSAVSAGVNGYYTVRFNVTVNAAPPGEYRLKLAQFLPRVGPDTVGPAAEMTNDPANAFFCLNVAPASRSR